MADPILAATGLPNRIGGGGGSAMNQGNDRKGILSGGDRMTVNKGEANNKDEDDNDNNHMMSLLLPKLHTQFSSMESNAPCCTTRWQEDKEKGVEQWQESQGHTAVVDAAGD